MATLYTRTIGSVSDAYISGGTGTITLKLVCTYTQTAQNNSSYVSIYVRAEVSNSSIDYKIGSWQITGNGPTGSGGETTIQSGTRNMTTKSKTIAHLSNGSQTFSSGAKVTMTYFYGVGKSKDVSFTLSNKSYALATINVYSSLSFTPSTPEMASAVTIGITKPSTSAFTATSAKITATYDGNTYTIYEGNAASYSWTVPDLAATTPDSTTKTIAIKVQSIRSGTTYSAKEYSLTVTVPAAYVPSCAFNTITDEYGFSSFIQGYSHLTIALKSGTAGSGASIVSYTIEVRNTNASGAIQYTATNTTSASTASFTMPDAIQAASTYIKATITDSRGRTGTITQNVSAVAYQQPQITISAVRCDADRNPDPFGTYCDVQVTWSVTQIGTDNYLSTAVRVYKSTDGVTYSQYATRNFANNVYSATFTLKPPLAINEQGWFLVETQDNVITTRARSSIKIVPKAILPISLFDNGTDVGVSVGQMATEGGLNIYLPTKTTQQIKTSFKEGIAMGSFQAASTTLPDLCNELRFSSGCMGSANITTAATYNGITIPATWYNFIYSPHRSGGVNGAASGDNCNYGTIILSNMTADYGTFRVRISSGAIQHVDKFAISTDLGVTIKGFTEVHVSSSSSVANGSETTLSKDITLPAGATTHYITTKQCNFGYVRSVSLSGSTFTAILHNASGASHTMTADFIIISI